LGDRTLVQVENTSKSVTQKHSGVFDALGRVLKDIGGVGQTTQYSYDNNGNALTITSPLTHVTTQGFDALDRLVNVTQPAPVGGSIVTTYDPHDRPLTVTDPNGGVTRYVYDGFGEMIEQISPDSGTTVYHYDADGNLTQKTDARGAIVNYQYDALDRVLNASYPADSTENVAYTYDQSGHGFGIGRLTSLADQAGTLDRSYDERGNITEETRQTATAPLPTFYAYDAASRISSITYPSAAAVAYARDIMGRITSITVKLSGSSKAVAVLSGVSYEPFGSVASVTFGNGIVETRAFDLDYRMTGLTDAGAATLQKLTYGYDADNNVKSIGDGVTSGNSQTLGYDVLDRLTSAAGGYGSLGYTYDTVGNRLTQTLGSVTTQYQYKPSSNQLTAIITGSTTETVGSTAAGNIANFSPAFGSVSSLTYNNANRLATVKGSNISAQYTYDAFGQRLIKTATGTTLYGYDLSGHLLEESPGSASTTDYIYLDGRPVATLKPSNGTLSFLLDDRLGTPQLATTNTQSTVWAANYQPFGSTGPISTSITQNLRLPGQYSDAESGFNYNSFRDYVSTLGRYIESDPKGLIGGLNTYGYVNENPLKWIDLSGTSPNNIRTSNSFDPSQWVPIEPWSDDVTFTAGNTIAIEASSLAGPLATNQFYFTVTAVPLNPDGTPQSSIASESWYEPVQYGSGRTGGTNVNQFVFQANPPNCASAFKWTVKIPPQQAAHDNSEYNTLQVFIPKQAIHPYQER
jgi:RHS repeat-associated protein